MFIFYITFLNIANMHYIKPQKIFQTNPFHHFLKQTWLKGLTAKGANIFEM